MRFDSKFGVLSVRVDSICKSHGMKIEQSRAGFAGDFVGGYDQPISNPVSP